MSLFNCNDKLYKELCFISRSNEELVIFQTDRETGDDISDPSYTACRMDWRKDQTAQSPLLISITGTIEQRIDDRDNVEKRAVVINLTEADKVILQGECPQVRRFGTVYVSSETESVPVFYGVHTIKGIA